MIYLPDTNVINYILKEIDLARNRFRLEARAGSTFVLSSMVHFEVTRYHKLIGAAKQGRAYAALTSSWPRIELTDADWDAAAQLWADRHRVGKPIEDADLLIAVAALKAGAVVVTNNERHFEGLGLTLENWTV